MTTSRPTIIIPMAGNGSRFTEAGYSLPKPLINVLGKTMIEAVIDNLQIDGNYIFIIQKQHNSHQITNLLRHKIVDCVVLEVDHITDGPARTALFAREYINNNQLIIINCDQIIEDFDFKQLQSFAKVNKADGVIGTFVSVSNKNSYVKLDDSGKIVDVREKQVISNIATNGLHFWNSGYDFVSSAIMMIEQEDKCNNEYYIAPTYKYLINQNKTILPYFYNLHYPIGTPYDLENYILLKTTEL